MGKQSKKDMFALSPIIELEPKNLAYGQHSTLLYVCDSGVPILYHISKSIPWVLSIP